MKLAYPRNFNMQVNWLLIECIILYICLASAKKIYPQTRYTLCHLLSELFLVLGEKVSIELEKLLNTDEGESI